MIIHTTDSLRQVKMIEDGALSDSIFANCKVAANLVDFAFEAMSTSYVFALTDQNDLILFQLKPKE